MRLRYKILLFALSLYSVGSTVFNSPERSSHASDTGISNSQNRFIVASYHLGSADLTDPDSIGAIADIISRFEINTGGFDFTLINYYTEPESRPQEIDLLPIVVDDVKQKFPDETDIIILCSAKTDYNSLPVSDPFKSLEQKDYILLLDAEINHGNENYDPVDPQIIITASSEEMVWEDAGSLSIDAEMSTGQETGTVLPTSQPGFSTIIIVNNEPEDTEDKKEGSSSKAFCFFGTTSN